MAKVSNCNLYLNRTANPRMSMPDDEVPYWSLYRITNEDGKRERKRMGVFTYKEMLDFVAAVNSHETFEAYPRLTNVERGSMMSYVGHVIKAKEYQHKIYALSKDILTQNASIQKGYQRARLRERFVTQVKKIEQLSNRADAPLSLFLSLKEIYEDEYIHLKEEIDFYDRSGLSDDEVYKRTEWRYMSQCGIIEKLSAIAVKIKAMIES